MAEGGERYGREKREKRRGGKRHYLRESEERGEVWGGKRKREGCRDNIYRVGRDAREV